jgi:putative permease
MKRAAFVTFVVLSTLLLLGALWAFRSAVLLFVLSMVVGAALRPVVNRLVHEGWSIKVAIGTVYLAAFGAVLAIIFVLGAEILIEVPQAAKALTTTYEQASAEWPGAGGFRAFLATRLPPPAQLYESVGHLDAGGVARVALDSSFGILALLGNVLIVIALAVYWSIDRDSFERLWLSLLPVGRRTRARAVWTEARIATGAIFRQELGQSVIAAVVLGFGFWALGLTYWGLAALAVALLRLVPLLGIPLAVIAAGLLGLGTSDVQAIGAAAAALIFLLLIRAVRGGLFDAPSLNPVLSVLVVLGLARVYGLAGLIVAPLVAAAIQSTFGELVSTQPADQGIPTLDDLRARAADIERAGLVLPFTPEVGNVVERLKRLLGRADAI